MLACGLKRRRSEGQGRIGRWRCIGGLEMGCDWRVNEMFSS